jgi:hypothetical protein
MSKLISNQSNLIIIGAWNPAIIQPAWLKKEFPTQIPDNFRIQVVTGVISSFIIEFDDFIIDPNGGRLVFTPKKFDEKTLSNISKLSNGIQELLRHTPIAAAGCNFVFSLDANEFFSIEKIETDEQIKSLYSSLSECALVAKSIGHVFSAEDHKISVNYDFQGITRFLRINYEYQQPLNPMKKAADSFLKNFNHAQELCKELLRSK